MVYLNQTKLFFVTID